MDIRPHPQTSYESTVINPNSFYGKLRSLYANTVLRTQLDQMKKQGSYEAFNLKWHPVYDIRRLSGARARMDATPPSLFWESDVGKWIEAACYFLSSSAKDSCSHADEFKTAIQELVDMIEKAQHEDGYLNIYFTVVDPEGRFRNLRDMHEMYNAGHLLEGALAHHHYTGSRQFIDVMIKNVDCFIKHFGPEPDQLHGYPGHPELELATMRLYAVTKDPKHLAFAKYLLSARGVKRDDQDGKTYFVHEADTRKDLVHGLTMDGLDDRGQTYNQSHLPLHDQNAILGHSVRAFYLTTAAADFGGPYLDDAKRLFNDAVDNKMYVTGGFGTEPRFEGFSPIPHHLPQSTGEGGCYAETCASIAAMMTGERILSHAVDGKVRDAMELCLHNAVLGGGSLDGKGFSYANKMATYGDEVATRADWFVVCCCPPNLSRTLGMLGGYTWSAKVDGAQKVIKLDVYLFVSATRTISLPDGQKAKVIMKSEMPWSGQTHWTVEAPEGWIWEIQIPKPDYAEDVVVGHYPYKRLGAWIPVPAYRSIEGDVHDDVSNIEIDGLPMVGLTSSSKEGSVYVLRQESGAAYRAVNSKAPARIWECLPNTTTLTLVPWFARANRGGAGHVRTGFLRADENSLYKK
ncbi:hypothetical protein FRB97_005014 [Tulasnella sp. 331]|nr:hypothetical protein FRB97_005014 [Tulasnella sp. 331]